jgi:alpha/beta superfamily hydrolase
VTAPQLTEQALFVDGPEGPLAAVVTAPEAPTGTGVVICPGGWYGTSTNRNRVVVRLARSLAGLGHTVVRFDWHGVGDSGGEVDRFVLDRPFVGDVVAVSGRLSATTDRLLVVGVCFGGRSALAAAPQMPSLAGLVLVSFPFPADQTKADWRARKVGWRGAMDVATNPELWRPAARWATRRIRPAPAGPRARDITLTPGSFRADMAVLRERGVTVDLVFGADDLERVSFEALRRGPLGEYLERSRPGIDVAVTERGDLSSFRSLDSQQTAIELITGIFRRRL